MTDPLGVCLLPASGEWVYDTLPRRAARAGDPAPAVLNLHASATRADEEVALDQLAQQFPGCGTVALVVAWFGSSTDAAQCRVHPSTNYPGGRAEMLLGGKWVAEPWRCSGLTQDSPGLIPLSSDANGNASYGGTPSDPSVVRCLRDLRARGYRTILYPFLLMDAPGYPWRGRIGPAGADRTVAANDAVAAFLGGAIPSQFTRDAADLTVGYGGPAMDWTFRRMILHYANLCVVAGGVDLFLIGSELRALEAVRGPGWTPAGTVAADGTCGWDYPFVDGLGRLAADVRSVFDGADLPRDLGGLHNLVGYSADWSSWMGAAHPDSGGTWPHLDQLWAHPAIDVVAFDNYLPLSDWTGGDGGLDAANWRMPAPTSWPPDAATMGGLGLAGPPSRYAKSYLKANIEGGCYFSWFYGDGGNRGRGPDPAGSAEQVSLPGGDRLAQRRSPYAAGQQLLAPKQLRWWWGSTHRATFDNGDGAGTVPRGAPSRWVPQSKAVTFAEYGFPTVDRCTNQPNVFYDPRSSESFTPYWSAWDALPGDRWAPRRDDALAAAAREALVEYWTIDGNNAVSAAGVPMVQTAFCCAWNWDARPFPAFPASAAWGDGPNWGAGTWIAGKGGVPVVAPPEAAPTPPPLPFFPVLAGRAARARWRPVQAATVAAHVSGRETRADHGSVVAWEIEFAWDRLAPGDLAGLVGFYAARRGDALPFAVPVPAELGIGSPLPCRFAETRLDVDQFAAALAATRTVSLRSVKLKPPPPFRIATCRFAPLPSARRASPMPPVFPALPGQGWSVHKRPTFSTRIASHVSGREVRTPLYAATLYEFELTVDALASGPGYGGVGAGTMQQLLGFVLACQGQLTPFLYVDPTDSFVSAQPIGTGDGVSTSFPVVRTIGGATEPVSWATRLANVTVGGAAAVGWSLVQPAVLSFPAAPAAGAAITADVGYAFLCRFLDDGPDFENLMGGLWQVRSLKFRSVRP